MLKSKFKQTAYSEGILEDSSIHRKHNVFVSFISSLFSFEFLFTLFLFAWAYKANPSLGWVPIDLTELFFILSVYSGILVFFAEKKRFKRKAAVLVFFALVFVFYILISLTWTVGIVYAQQKALYFSTLTLWSLVACAFIIASDKKRLIRFIRFLLVFAIWIAIESTLEYLKGGHDVINAMNSNYLALGYTLGMGLLISAAYGFLSENSRLKRTFMFMLALYFMFLLMVMGGRGPLLSLAISLFIPLSFGSNLVEINKSKLKKYAAFITVLFLSIFFISFYLYLKDSLTSTLYRLLLFLEPGMGTSAGTRMDYYLTSEKLWVLKPLLGYGIGSWPILKGLPDMNSYPHNLIFEILVELGLTGLILFGSIVFVALKGFKRSHNSRNIFLGSVILMMFVNAFVGAMLSGDINDNRIIFALLGLMAFEEDGNEKQGMHSDNSTPG